MGRHGAGYTPIMTTTTDPLLNTLLEIERAGWTSLSDGTASDFYGETMSDEALMVLGNGQVMRRDQVVDALRDAPPWRSFELDDVHVIRLDDSAAALVYTASASREQGDPFVAAMSSVYVRTAARWRLALYQQTPVAN